MQIRTRIQNSRKAAIARTTMACRRGFAKCARFWQDRRAGIAPIAAFAAIPLMGSVGVAVDYGNALSMRTKMQNALDSTALSLVQQEALGVDVSGQAQQMFGALFVQPQVSNVTVTADVSSGSYEGSVSLNASGFVPTTFLGVIGYSSLRITTHSSAYASTDTSGCVLALNTSASGAIAVGGSSTVALKGCSLYSNSNSATSITVGGSASLSASLIGTVGKVSLSGNNVTTTEGIRTGIPQLKDPYRNVAFPAFGSCTETNFTAKTTLTINPGVYCNGISVNAGAVLTLNPGIYYIDRGNFNVNGGGTISGTGVTLVLTSSTGNNWPTVSINGNATVDLRAPSSGATAGIVIFGDRSIPQDTAFKFNGDSNQTYGGAIYVPSGAISYSGGSGTSTSCTQIIGDTVNFTGSSDVAVNCSGYNTKPFGVVSVRLTS